MVVLVRNCMFIIIIGFILFFMFFVEWLIRKEEIVLRIRLERDFFRYLGFKYYFLIIVMKVNGVIIKIIFLFI